jgi:RNA polymerase sigma-70 factor (ECF subfamily)
VSDRSTAEDIAQEALVRFLACSVDLATPIWPWLKTVASNLICDGARSSERERMLLERAPGDVSYEQPGGFEEREALVEALNRLNVRQQTALRLRYLDDWNRAEVAHFLGVTALALDQVLFRARARLLDEYQKLSGGASALLFGLRFAWRRHLERLQASPSAGSLSQMAASTGLQLTAVVAVLVGGAQVGSVPSRHGYASDGPLLIRMTRQLDPERSSYAFRVAHGAGGVSRAAVGERAPTDREPVVKDADEIVADVTDPNRDVHQPEDATITSLAFRHGEQGSPGMMYAVGKTNCATAHCPLVLFRSTDSARSWQRLAADGLQGDELLVPQDSAAGQVLFAMGRGGLQVSADGGKTFAMATSVPAAVAGSAAISPTFGTGDSSILVGGQTLMRYSHDQRTMTPTPNPLGPGPLEPAYSPNYAQDGLTYIGGVSIDPMAGKPKSTIWTCQELACDRSFLEGLNQAPKLRFAESPKDGTALVFTQDQIFQGTLGQEASLAPLLVPRLAHEIVRDAALLSAGTALVSTRSREGAGGILLRSTDKGGHWAVSSSPLLASGAGAILAVPGGDLVLLARGKSGVACSMDRGATWQKRC